MQGYRDGVKHQEGRIKGSCNFVHLCCVIIPCFFLFGYSRHSYIPLHFERFAFIVKDSWQIQKYHTKA